MVSVEIDSPALMRLIKSNPCANLGAIKVKKVERLPFSDMDIEMLRDACKKPRDRALLEFLIATGCRVSEVCSVNIDDVDFDKLECIVLGKGNKERTVYIDSGCALSLRK